METDRIRRIADADDFRTLTILDLLRADVQQTKACTKQTLDALFDALRTRFTASKKISEEVLLAVVQICVELSHLGDYEASKVTDCFSSSLLAHSGRSERTRRAVAVLSTTLLKCSPGVVKAALVALATSGIGSADESVRKACLIVSGEVIRVLGNVKAAAAGVVEVTAAAVVHGPVPASTTSASGPSSASSLPPSAGQLDVTPIFLAAASCLGDPAPSVVQCAERCLGRLLSADPSFEHRVTLLPQAEAHRAQLLAAHMGSIRQYSQGLPSSVTPTSTAAAAKAVIAAVASSTSPGVSSGAEAFTGAALSPASMAGDRRGSAGLEPPPESRALSPVTTVAADLSRMRSASRSPAPAPGPSPAPAPAPSSAGQPLSPLVPVLGQQIVTLLSQYTDGRGGSNMSSEESAVEVRAQQIDKMAKKMAAAMANEASLEATALRTYATPLLIAVAGAIRDPAPKVTLAALNALENGLRITNASCLAAILPQLLGPAAERFADTKASVRSTAVRCVASLSCALGPSYVFVRLFPLLQHRNRYIRESTLRTIAQALVIVAAGMSNGDGSAAGAALSALQAVDYRQLLSALVPLLEVPSGLTPAQVTAAQLAAILNPAAADSVGPNLRVYATALETSTVIDAVFRRLQPLPRVLTLTQDSVTESSAGQPVMHPTLALLLSEAGLAQEGTAWACLHSRLSASASLPPARISAEGQLEMACELPAIVQRPIGERERESGSKEKSTSSPAQQSAQAVKAKTPASTAKPIPEASPTLAASPATGTAQSMPKGTAGTDGGSSKANTASKSGQSGAQGPQVGVKSSGPISTAQGPRMSQAGALGASRTSAAPSTPSTLPQDGGRAAVDRTSSPAVPSASPAEPTAAFGGVYTPREPSKLARSSSDGSMRGGQGQGGGGTGAGGTAEGTGPLATAHSGGSPRPSGGKSKEGKGGKASDSHAGRQSGPQGAPVSPYAQLLELHMSGTSATSSSATTSGGSSLKARRERALADDKDRGSVATESTGSAAGVGMVNPTPYAAPVLGPAQAQRGAPGGAGTAGTGTGGTVTPSQGAKQQGKGSTKSVSKSSSFTAGNAGGTNGGSAAASAALAAALSEVGVVLSSSSSSPHAGSHGGMGAGGKSPGGPTMSPIRASGSASQPLLPANLDESLKQAQSVYSAAVGSVGAGSGLGGVGGGGYAAKHAAKVRTAHTQGDRATAQSTAETSLPSAEAQSFSAPVPPHSPLLPSSSDGNGTTTRSPPRPVGAGVGAAQAQGKSLKTGAQTESAALRVRSRIRLIDEAVATASSSSPVGGAGGGGAGGSPRDRGDRGREGKEDHPGALLPQALRFSDDMLVNERAGAESLLHGPGSSSASGGQHAHSAGPGGRTPADERRSEGPSHARGKLSKPAEEVVVSSDMPAPPAAAAARVAGDEGFIVPSDAEEAQAMRTSLDLLKKRSRQASRATSRRGTSASAMSVGQDMAGVQGEAGAEVGGGAGEGGTGRRVSNVPSPTKPGFSIGGWLRGALGVGSAPASSSPSKAVSSETSSSAVALTQLRTMDTPVSSASPWSAVGQGTLSPAMIGLRGELELDLSSSKAVHGPRGRGSAQSLPMGVSPAGDAGEPRPGGVPGGGGGQNAVDRFSPPASLLASHSLPYMPRRGSAEGYEYAMYLQEFGADPYPSELPSPVKGRQQFSSASASATMLRSSASSSLGYTPGSAQQGPYRGRAASGFGIAEPSSAGSAPSRFAYGSVGSAGGHGKAGGGAGGPSGRSTPGHLPPLGGRTGNRVGSASGPYADSVLPLSTPGSVGSSFDPPSDTQGEPDAYPAGEGRGGSTVYPFPFAAEAQSPKHEPYASRAVSEGESISGLGYGPGGQGGRLQTAATETTRTLSSGSGNILAAGPVRGLHAARYDSAPSVDEGMSERGASLSPKTGGVQREGSAQDEGGTFFVSKNTQRKQGRDRHNSNSGSVPQASPEERPIRPFSDAEAYYRSLAAQPQGGSTLQAAAVYTEHAMSPQLPSSQGRKEGLSVGRGSMTGEEADGDDGLMPRSSLRLIRTAARSAQRPTGGVQAASSPLRAGSSSGMPMPATLVAVGVSTGTHMGAGADMHDQMDAYSVGTGNSSFEFESVDSSQGLGGPGVQLSTYGGAGNRSHTRSRSRRHGTGGTSQSRHAAMDGLPFHAGHVDTSHLSTDSLGSHGSLSSLVPTSPSHAQGQGAVSTAGHGLPSGVVHTERLYIPSSALMPIPPQQLEHAIRTALVEIGLTDGWEKQFEACTTIRRLALHHPGTLTASASGQEGNLASKAGTTVLHAFMASILVAVDSLRSSLAKAACMALTDLFLAVGRSMDDLIESITPILVRRASDTNEFMAAAAGYSLATMVHNCSEGRVLAALLACSGSKTGSVRMGTALWLDRMAEKMGYKLQGHKELNRLVDVAVRYAQEGLPVARHAGTRIVQRLMRQGIVTEKLLSKIIPERTLHRLRPQLDKPAPEDTAYAALLAGGGSVAAGDGEGSQLYGSSASSMAGTPTRAGSRSRVGRAITAANGLRRSASVGAGLARPGPGPGPGQGGEGGGSMEGGHYPRASPVTTAQPGPGDTSFKTEGSLSTQGSLESFVEDTGPGTGIGMGMGGMAGGGKGAVMSAGPRGRSGTQHGKRAALASATAAAILQSDLTSPSSAAALPSEELDSIVGLSQLSSKDWRDRLAAVQALPKQLSTLNPASSTALSARLATELVSRVTDGNVKVATAAVIVLPVVLGTSTAEAAERMAPLLLPALASALSSSTGAIVEGASTALDALLSRCDSGTALGPLASAVRGTSSGGTAKARVFLVERLTALLTHAGSGKKQLSSGSLLRTVLPSICPLLEDSKAETRAAVGECVCSLGALVGKNKVWEAVKGTATGADMVPALHSSPLSPAALDAVGKALGM